jgi:hypothetical protein
LGALIDWFSGATRRAARRCLEQWSDWPPAGTDALIVSYPKAGRTWLRVLLPAALALARGAPADADLDRWLAGDAVHHAGRTVFFTHALASRESVGTDDLRAFAHAWRRTPVLFIVRDPRDLVVSYFFQRTKRRRPAKGGRPVPPDVASFIRDPQFGAPRIIEMFNIWYRALRRAPRAMMLSYETLHADPARGTRDAIRFLFGLEIGDDVSRRAAEYATFRNMRALELSDRFAVTKRLWTRDKSDPDGFKTRKGRIGSFGETLSDADIAFVDRLIATRLAPELRYRNPGDTPPGFTRTGTKPLGARLASLWSRTSPSGAPDQSSAGS